MRACSYCLAQSLDRAATSALAVGTTLTAPISRQSSDVSEAPSARDGAETMVDPFQVAPVRCLVITVIEDSKIFVLVFVCVLNTNSQGGCDCRCCQCESGQPGWSVGV